ncbi:hypothetical protein Tco_1313943 [Tanacetum coccineum]
MGVGLVAKDITSIATSSSWTISKHCLRSYFSLSSSIFCFFATSCSSSSPAFFELLSCAISALAFLSSFQQLVSISTNMFTLVMALSITFEFLQMTCSSIDLACIGVSVVLVVDSPRSLKVMLLALGIVESSVVDVLFITVLRKLVFSFTAKILILALLTHWCSFNSFSNSLLFHDDLLHERLLPPKKRSLRVLCRSSSLFFCLPQDFEMPPKRTSTFEAPAMNQAAIKKLVADSVTAARDEQLQTMAAY